MDAFSGTYSAALGINRKLILTQNPDFINYILKENHRNYTKPELSTERAVNFFGKGLLIPAVRYMVLQNCLVKIIIFYGEVSVLRK